MYSTLLIVHSIFRWALVGMLAYMIGRSFAGYRQNLIYTPVDNALRHWTATVAHIQLMIGMVLYFKSPLVSYFWKNPAPADLPFDFSFFSLLHITLMILAVILLTVGSAMAKRTASDQEKFRTIFLWFLAGLILIAVAIPWPFSPLAQRPLIRNF